MDKFETFSGIAAPMPLVNIDTDMIIPKQFLKTIKRSGLGVHAFDEMRYDDDGNEIPDFVLNQSAYREASILIAGDTLVVDHRANTRHGPCPISGSRLLFQHHSRTSSLTTVSKTECYLSCFHRNRLIC